MGVTARKLDYSWFIDTVPPTATVHSEQTYTNAEELAIDATFSEACSGQSGFKCMDSSNCDVIIKWTCPCTCIITTGYGTWNQIQPRYNSVLKKYVWARSDHSGRKYLYRVGRKPFHTNKWFHYNHSLW